MKILIVLLTLLLSFSAYGNESEYSETSVIVKFKANASPADRARERANANASFNQDLRIVPGLERMKVPRGNVRAVINRLSRSPFVEYAEVDYRITRSQVIPNDTFFQYIWGLRNTGQDGGTAGIDIRATQAWSVTTGSSDVVIAVLDTGTQLNHNDLQQNLWVNPVDGSYGYNFHDGNNVPEDDDGHGTHVAGTIAAVTNNSNGVAGVCWTCQIMTLRFMGLDGGYTSDAILSLAYAVERGVMISNNSWGGPGYSQALYDAIAAAGAQGHLFVAAAGNETLNIDVNPMYPAAYNLPNILSVASITNTGSLSSFSNYGVTRVHVAAPGSMIASTFLDNGYVYMGGTSMAAPYVAGLAGLLLSLNPDWTYVELKEVIMNTVRPLSSLQGITVTGGLVDAEAAVAEAQATMQTDPPADPQRINIR